MKKRWVINTPPETTKIEELSKKLNCHPVIANLLLQRGITSSEQAQSFFLSIPEYAARSFLNERYGQGSRTFRPGDRPR